MNIRPMLLHELDNVLDLWSNMCEDVGLTYSKVMWIQETIPMLSSGNYGIFVIEEDGKIVGFADYLLKPEAGESALIAITRHLYIDKNYRKFGFAGKLIDAVLNTVKNAGAKKIYFHTNDATMLKWNQHGFDVKSTVYERTL